MTHRWGQLCAVFAGDWSPCDLPGPTPALVFSHSADSRPLPGRSRATPRTEETGSTHGDTPAPDRSSPPQGPTVALTGRLLLCQVGLRKGSRAALAGRAGLPGWGCFIPSTSRWATTPWPGRKLGDDGGGLVTGLQPGHGAVGRCQDDGMPHGSQRSRSSVVARHRQGGARRIDQLWGPCGGPPTSGRRENRRELLRGVSAFQDRFSSLIAWSARAP
jgi:hypothetical protein